jgi:hypothetical protein
MREKLQNFEAGMDAEFENDLTPDQWAALKALRVPAQGWRGLNRSVVESLIALDLAGISEDRPILTRKGRSVLLRGSPRLWDLAA